MELNLKWHGDNECWMLLEDASHLAICWRLTKKQARLKEQNSWRINGSFSCNSEGFFFNIYGTHAHTFINLKALAHSGEIHFRKILQRDVKSGITIIY